MRLWEKRRSLQEKNHFLTEKTVRFRVFFRQNAQYYMKYVVFIFILGTMKKSAIVITAFFAGILFFAPATRLEAQEFISLAIVLENGDTVPMFNLNTVVVKAQYFTDKEKRRNKKLIRNVKKTLPYAKKAKNKLVGYDKAMLSMSERQRKEYMKKAEKEIEDEFGAELKKLTFSQGHVLIKLIDRETGSTSFELVQELRGKFRAFFYQTFAKIFGYDLKAKFDPVHNSKDRMIDRVARGVETGRL